MTNTSTAVRSDRSTTVPTWISRVVLSIGIATLGIGLWTFFAPRSFYADFPISGAGWVSTLGAYNEHLTIDFGAAQIGLAIAAIGTAWSTSLRATVSVLGGFVVFGSLHVGYHLTTFDAFSASSAVSQTLALTTFVVVPAAALIGIVRSQRKGNMT